MLNTSQKRKEFRLIRLPSCDVEVNPSGSDDDSASVIHASVLYTVSIHMSLVKTPQ